MNRVLGFLNRLSRPSLWAVALCGMALLGAIDFLSGFEVSFSFFYLLPVSLAAWKLGRKAGIILSVLSAATWLGSNLLAGERYSGPLIPYWNAATRAGFFIVTVYLLSELSRLYDAEKKLARTDFVTGAANSRAFYQALGLEIARSARSQKPLTLVYLDVDNFKQINDALGHHAGDSVLSTVAQTCVQNTRVNDLTARVGGDEFVILLPETDQESAQAVVTRLRQVLRGKMQASGWPITFSMGVLTCQEVSVEAQEMIRMADQLMYEVKSHGKDNVTYARYPAAT